MLLLFNRLTVFSSHYSRQMAPSSSLRYINSHRQCQSLLVSHRLNTLTCCSAVHTQINLYDILTTYDDHDDADDGVVYVDHTPIIIASSVVGAVALIAIICALQFIRQVQVCLIVRVVSRLCRFNLQYSATIDIKAKHRLRLIDVCRQQTRR